MDKIKVENDSNGVKDESKRRFMKWFVLGTVSAGLAACTPKGFLEKVTEEAKATPERPKNYAKVSYGGEKSCFEATTEAFKLVTGSTKEEPISKNNSTTENPMAKYMFVKKEDGKVVGIYLFNNHDNLYNFLRDGKMETDVEQEMAEKLGNEGEAMVATGNILEFSDEIKVAKNAWRQNPNLDVQMVFTESVVTTDTEGRPMVQQGVVNHYKGEGVFQRLEID